MESKKSQSFLHQYCKINITVNITAYYYLSEDIYCKYVNIYILLGKLYNTESSNKNRKYVNLFPLKDTLLTQF